MRKKLPTLSVKNAFLGSVFLVLFIAFTFTAKFGFLTQFDFNTTVKSQNHVPHRLLFPLSLLSLLARFDVILIVLIAYVVVRRTIRSFLVLILFGAAHIVEYIGKLMLDHPGPPFMFYKATETVYFPDLYVSGSSYPSGHALRSVFIAVLLMLFLLRSKTLGNMKIVALLIVWVSVGSLIIGKVVLGQHWTSDVIGGTLLGLSFGFFAQSLN